MAYIFRVTLSGIKGFYRVYKVNGTNSLYSLHKQMRSDMEFPLDQPILFKALDENGNVIARYALVDLGFGTVDHVSIADALKAQYDMDVDSKKLVIDEPIKSYGTYQVKAKLGYEISGIVNVLVVEEK